jgi:hypothetical protein
VAATFPYLALKLNWVLGGTIGMADPGVFDNPWYRVANLVTLAMDLAVVLAAAALTHPRRRELQDGWSWSRHGPQRASWPPSCSWSPSGCWRPRS